MRRWLLALGSNLDDDHCVRQALERLAELGTLTPLTAIRRLPADDGSPADYYNALATLSAPLDRAALQLHLKRLEAELGRRHGAGTPVAIDLDILAVADGNGAWLADAHELGKGGFDGASVRMLLREAGIEVECGIGNRERGMPCKPVPRGGPQ